MPFVPRENAVIVPFLVLVVLEPLEWADLPFPRVQIGLRTEVQESDAGMVTVPVILFRTPRVLYPYRAVARH